MGRWRVLLCAAAVAVFAGCGDDETGDAGAPAGVDYMAANGWIAVLPTDLEGEQLRRFERLIEPTLREVETENTLREVLAGEAEAAGLSFARDVEPLLGGALVVGTGGEAMVIVLETSDGERLGEVLDRLEMARRGEHRGAELYGGPGLAAAIDGAALVLAFGAEDAEGELRAAIDRERDGRGFDESALPGTDGDALLRAAWDGPAALEAFEIGPVPELPWVQAVRSFGLVTRLEADAVAAHARVDTDPAGLEEADLPLAPGDESPPAGAVDGAIAAANRDQSRTTVFLAQLARRLYPDSQFVRSVEAVEADLGISFEEEVLAQFNGPSASVATPDGQFAAVSDVADPERMRALLPRLAPRLPAVLQGLEALGGRGLLALLLFAPDAPLAPGLAPALQGGIGVRQLPGAGDELLFELSGLEPPLATERVVFGMIGDRFVVATDERRARDVVEMPVSEIDGARGAGVARADLGTWSEEAVEQAIGFRLPPLGETVGELEASLEGLEARLRVEVPGGLD